MVKSIIGPNLGQSTATALRQNDRAVGDRPRAPHRLARFADTASLPNAADWPGCMAYKTDAKVPVISDGTFWYPITVGAHL